MNITIIITNTLILIILNILSLSTYADTPNATGSNLPSAESLVVAQMTCENSALQRSKDIPEQLISDYCVCAANSGNGINVSVKYLANCANKAKEQKDHVDFLKFGNVQKTNYAARAITNHMKCMIAQKPIKMPNLKKSLFCSCISDYDSLEVIDRKYSITYLLNHKFYNKCQNIISTSTRK